MWWKQFRRMLHMLRHLRGNWDRKTAEHWPCDRGYYTDHGGEWVTESVECRCGRKF